jgi:predicted MFS family arabinose efflux permease
MALGQNIARISGPSLGGLLIGFTGVSSLFIVQAACFATAAALTLTLHAQKRVRSRGEGFLTSLRAGLAYVRHHREMTGLLLLALFPPLLVYPYVSFYTVFVTDVLHEGSGALGLLSGAVGFGSIFGSLYVAWSAHHRRRGLVLIAATLIYVSTVFTFAFQKHFWPAFSILVFAGIFNAIYGAVNNSLIQRTVSDQYRGRVMSLYIMTFAMIPIGGLLMGLLISARGTPFAFGTFTATCAVACSLVVAFSPSLRRL